MIHVATVVFKDWSFVIFEQCETHAQLRERETLWQHGLKSFYQIRDKRKGGVHILAQ